MENTLPIDYQVLLWDWTWAMLKADRLRDVENRFGKKFADWAINERSKLTDVQGADAHIPIYSGSLAIILNQLDIDIETERYYVHEQPTPSAVWTIPHPMNMKPSVTTVDDLDVTFEGEVEYIDNYNLTVTLNEAVSGKAYLS